MQSKSQILSKVEIFRKFGKSQNCVIFNTGLYIDPDFSRWPNDGDWVSGELTFSAAFFSADRSFLFNFRHSFSRRRFWLFKR